MLPRRESKPLEYAALVPMFGGIEKKARQLDREVMTMGRARGSDICLDGNEVSALHCIVFRGCDGYRVRDCGSRTGTRINGQSIKNALLGNGDVLQIGPFSFEVRVPRTFEHNVTIDPLRFEKLKRSRSRLAQTAMRLREKLIAAQRGGGHVPGNGKPAGELTERASDLKAKIKQYDQRLNQLEESEQELLQEKEDLEKLRQEFQRQVQLREAEVAKRRKELEDEFNQRWEGVQKELEALRNSRIPVPANLEESGAFSPDFDAGQQSLAARRAELESLSQHLESRAQEVERELDRLTTERKAFDEQQTVLAAQHAEAQRQLADARQELARQRSEVDARRSSPVDTAAHSVAQQKAQLATMIGELKNLQDELQKQAGLEAAGHEAELARLRRELDEARSQRIDENQVHELLRQLDAAQEELRTLRQHPPEDPRVAQFQAEIEALRQLSAAPPAAGEIDRLREENGLLKTLADELQQRFLQAGPTAPADSDAGKQLEELKGENAVLRRLLDEAEGHRSSQSTADDRALAQLEVVRRENQLLQDLLREKDGVIEEMKHHAETGGGDPESYEAELNHFRKELEADRAKLNQEIESLRQRNTELDEATREMEMELSRERAEMARERVRIDRLREEVKVDMDRLQREHEVRGSLATVHKLREEIAQRTVDPRRPSERPRTMRKLPER